MYFFLFTLLYFVHADHQLFSAQSLIFVTGIKEKKILFHILHVALPFLFTFNFSCSSILLTFFPFLVFQVLGGCSMGDIIVFGLIPLTCLVSYDNNNNNSETACKLGNVTKAKFCNVTMLNTWIMRRARH